MYIDNRETNYFPLFNGEIEAYAIQANSKEGYVIRYLLNNEGKVFKDLRTEKVYGHVRILNVHTLKDPEDEKYIFDLEYHQNKK